MLKNNKLNKNIAPLILAGGGGHCRSCIDVIETSGLYDIKGIVQPTNSKNNYETILGYNIIGTDKDFPELIKNYQNVLITVGQIKNPDARIHLYEMLKGLNVNFPLVTSPFANISIHSKIDEGSIIMHGAIINAGSKIGKNCIINSLALIEHDVVIGNHCHISTGVIINGNVKIQDGCFIGSGSILREGIIVGRNVVIGAGQLILKDIPDNSIIKGNL